MAARRARCWMQVHGLCRKRDRRSRRLDDLEDPQAAGPPARPGTRRTRPRGRRRARPRPATTPRGAPHARPFLFEARVGRQQAAQLGENDAHLRGRRRVGDADRRMEPELVAPREVFDLPRHDGAVRDTDHGALAGAQARGPERDVLHVAELAADPAGVADAQGPVREDGKAAEHVLEALLRREREHEAADAQACQRRRHVHAEDGEARAGEPGRWRRRAAPGGRARATIRPPCARLHHAAQQVAVHDVDDPQEHPQASASSTT